MMLAALMGKSNPADDYARKMGFPSAAAMQAYHQHEMQRITSRSTPGTDASSPSATGSPAADGALSIHPAVLFQHILNAWNRATGGQ